MPRVSVIIPSYNHAKYIRECLQSVMDQTYQDFEIIITDDGSSDNSIKIIKEFNDPRIHLFIHPVNKGGCVTQNNCILNSTGQYIAVLSSDDVWEPVKLEKQVSYLDNHPEIAAVFTKAVCIDETSRRITHGNNKYLHIFEKENRTRFEWLRYFFYEGNCLCHPSVLIRKFCYDDVGLYDERMANLPDLDMWVRLCSKYEIHILNDELVRFRLRRNNVNASGGNFEKNVRGNFELKQILNHYLTINNKKDFLKIFPESNKYGELESQYIAYFLCRLALDVSNNIWHLWGLEVLYNFIGKKENALDLENKYGFSYIDFYRLTAQYNVFKLGSKPILSSFFRHVGWLLLMRRNK
jgi:glycosyltransferase involved in cell wall biosynthesis